MTTRAPFPDSDRLTRFMLECSDLRGVLVRLERAWSAIIGHGRYPEPVADLLGQASVAAALFTGHIKVDGQLSIQLSGTGALRTLFAECTSRGRLRGIAQFNEPLPVPLSPRAFGPGSALAITIESTPPGAHEPTRYQSLVSLQADTLSAAFQDYFDQSEQLPTRIALAADGGVATGLMLQRLPGCHGDSDGWNRAGVLLDTLQRFELLELPGPQLLRRLFHEEGIRLLDSQPLAFGCSCNRGRVSRMLTTLGRDEALSAAPTGMSEITCEFCHQTYRFDRVDIEALFREPAGAAPERLQ